jgi:hypothetical protein
VADRVLVALPGVGTLDLPRDVYEAHLLRAPMPTPSNDAPALPPAVNLVDGTEMARRTNLPVSYLMERARRGTLPSVMAGKYRRFDPDAVIDALRTNQLVASKVARKQASENRCDRSVTGFPKLHPSRKNAR